MSELEPARFLIRDNRSASNSWDDVRFMFGFWQLFIFLDLEELPDDQKQRAIKSLNNGAPAMISHYTIVKDLFYKGDF